MIHLYYGNGKGKTTAAVGLAARFCAYGAVVFAQFLKGGQTGELAALEKLGARVLRQNEKLPFTFCMDAEQKQLCAAEQERIFCEAAALCPSACGTGNAVRAGSGAWDNEVPPKPPRALIVFDEIVDALETGMLARALVKDFLRVRAADTAIEIVLTGHSAPAWLTELAAYITLLTKQKHPFDAGLAARAGVEF